MILKQREFTVEGTFLVCCHPEISLLWQRDLRTSRSSLLMCGCYDWLYTWFRIKFWQKQFHTVAQKVQTQTKKKLQTKKRKCKQKRKNTK